MIKQIINSLAVLLSVSLFVSGLLLFFDISFWKSFIGTTSLQIAFFVIRNNIYKYVAYLKLEKERLLLEQLQQKNMCLVECQNCKMIGNIDVDLSSDNMFECSKCNSINRIDIKISTVLQTKPIA